MLFSEKKTMKGCSYIFHWKNEGPPKYRKYQKHQFSYLLTFRCMNSDGRYTFFAIIVWIIMIQQIDISGIYFYQFFFTKLNAPGCKDISGYSKQAMSNSLFENCGGQRSPWPSRSSMTCATGLTLSFKVAASTSGATFLAKELPDARLDRSCVRAQDDCWDLPS